jgi:hypothetical protein
MASNYTVIGSESSIQVLSPTLTQPIVQTTLVTSPSKVVASLALDQADFDAGTAGAILEPFAANIETIMGMNIVIAGQGSQSLDPNGLLQDSVDFTVQYVNPAVPGSSLTVVVSIPAGMLTAVEEFGGVGGIATAEQMIRDAYDKLAAL